MEIEVKQRNEELVVTEEELRQNLEELQATQEELERKNSEEQLMREELEKEKYLMDVLMDNIPDLIYFKDNDCRFLRVSSSMVKLFKADSPSDLTGKCDFDFHGKENANKVFS